MSTVSLRVDFMGQGAAVQVQANESIDEQADIDELARYQTLALDFVVKNVFYGVQCRVGKKKQDISEHLANIWIEPLPHLVDQSLKDANNDNPVLLYAIS